MKITVILLTVVSLSISAKSFSQTITYSGENVSLKQVFSAIQQQTGYSFFYNDAASIESKNITVAYNQAKLETVLNELLGKHHLSYDVYGETVFVYEKIQPKVKIVSEQIEQAPPIHGTVIDSATGEPIVGATIKVKGKTKGTVTDADGKFSLEVEDNAVLEVSFLGYGTKIIPVSGKESLTISLSEAATGLNQLVVVGYGKERKVDLTGAVDQIDGEQISRGLGSKTGQLIQGLIPNMNVTYNNGGINESANINIRGVGSINGSGPLILIDGIQGDLNHLNPSDIKSITVLKDAAAAAIYGAKAAFGVILITTKTGQEGKLKFNYNGRYAVSMPTIRTDNFITNPLKWAKLSDTLSRLENSSTYLGYTQADYDYLKRRLNDPTLPDVLIKTINGAERYVPYGSTDWWHTVFSDRQPSMQHTLSVSGGGDKASFYLSGRYYKRKGIYKINPDILNSYNVRAKVNLNLTNWLHLENNTNIYIENYHYPVTNQRDISGASDHENWRKYTFHASPLYLPHNPDGTIMINSPRNPGYDIADGTFADLIYGKAFGNQKSFDVTNTVTATVDLFKSLKLKGEYSFRKNPSSAWDRKIATPNTNQPGGENITLFHPERQTYVETYRRRLYQAVNVYATYSKNIGKDHFFKGMIGYNQEWRTWKRVIARRNGNLSDKLNSFNLATGDNIELDSRANAWATRSGFYRLNYRYRNKYLFEFNGRYDLSSKFPKSKRAGFFPSASAGWRINKEPFFNSLSRYINNLKIRASYGSLGNQNVGEYDYISTMGVRTSSYIRDGKKIEYLTSPQPVSSNFTWERVATIDFGLDMAIFKNRFNVSFDWYRRNTYNMLTQGKKLPSVFGASEPKENAADLSTKGFELTLKWRDKINMTNPITYHVRLILANNRTTITKFDNPKGLIDQYYDGKVLGEVWGYTVEGFFKSDNEYLKHADQTRVDDRIVNNYLISHPVAGDIKFKDANGDGVIGPGDKTLSDHGDLKRIGNTSAQLPFSLSFGGEFNGFDLNVLLQGIMKKSWWPGHDNGRFWGPFTRQYENFYPKSIVAHTWSPDNPNAYFPRLAVYAANGHHNYEGAQLRVHSDKYLQDVGYLRLKNISIGYTLPEGLFKSAKDLKIRFYISGENILTFSKLYKHNWDHTMDPEQLGDGNSYPFLKSYAVGVNINF